MGMKNVKAPSGSPNRGSEEHTGSYTTAASPLAVERVNGGSPATAEGGAQQASPAEGGRARNQASEGSAETAGAQSTTGAGNGEGLGSMGTIGTRGGAQTASAPTAQNGAQNAQGEARTGSMGTRGSIGGGHAGEDTTGGKPEKAASGTKDNTQTASATNGAQDDPKPGNVVRDRSGNVVYDADGKPVTYGGGGKLTNVQLYELLNQPQELTPEEKKREKRQKLFAAIGDGISALSNLYFTTKGAPNMYSGKNTQSEKETTYWDKLRQDREAKRKRYVDGYLKALQADDLAAIRQQNADTQKAAKEAEAERKKAEAERKDELAKAQAEVYRARAAKDDAATEMSEKTLEYMNTYGWPLKRAKAQADIDLTKARREKALSGGSGKHTGGASPAGGGRAQNGAGGGSTGGSGKYYGTFNGVAYRTKADYDKAVVDYAKGNKIPLTYNKESTDKYGRKRTTQTNRTVPGLAAAGEADYKAKRALSGSPNRGRVEHTGGHATANRQAASAAGAPAGGGRAQNQAGARAKAAPAARPAYTHTKSLGL